jgi:hypothetical protein
VGGALLAAIAFMTSASDMENAWYRTAGDREGVVRRSLVYGLVGLCVIGLGVLLEAFG